MMIKIIFIFCTAIVGLNAGLFSYADNYTEKDIAYQQKGEVYYPKACDNGYELACIDQGVILEKSNRHKTAKKYYEKACNMGAPSGCERLANLFFFGKGVKKDYEKSNKLYKKACDNMKYPDGDACYNLAISYTNGEGIEQDYKEANRLFQKACDTETMADACNSIATSYYLGRGVKKDYFKALKLFSRACNKDGGEGCKNYRILKSMSTLEINNFDK